MNALEALIRAEAISYLLEISRISGLIVISPLAWQSAPARLRVGLVLALAAVAHGVGGGSVRAEPLPIALGVAWELGVGLAMGFVVRLAVSVAEVAAEIIAPMMGLGAAHLFDPHAGSGTVLTSLFRHFAIFVALIVGVHRVVLGALIESFRVLPVGTSESIALATPVLLRLSADALSAGVRIAVPVVVILFMVQIALAFISRAAPALQIFSLGFAVTLGVGWMSLIIVSPDLTMRIIAELSHVGEGLEGVVASLNWRAP